MDTRHLEGVENRVGANLDEGMPQALLFKV